MQITPQYVLQMKKPASHYFCSAQDNIYDLNFTNLKIRDYNKNEILFDINNDKDQNENIIRYDMGYDFFDIQEIGTQLTFSVGNQNIKILRMIELHFFRNKQIQKFDFTFPFCMANSVNTWENIYTVPKKKKQLMI